MTDEAADTFSGGARATLGTFGFLLPMGGLDQLLLANPAVLPVWGSWALIVIGLSVVRTFGTASGLD